MSAAGEPIATVLIETVDLRGIEAACPGRTVALAEFAVRVMETQRDQLEAIPKPWPEEV